MATGTARWFNDAERFGFITPDEGGDDLFAHFSEICSEGFKGFVEGQKVTFEAKMEPKVVEIFCKNHTWWVLAPNPISINVVSVGSQASTKSVT